MMKLFVWDRSLPNNYYSSSSKDGLEHGASAIVIAPSVKSAIELVEAKIVATERYGTSDHYKRMVVGMKEIKPTSALPMTTPGRTGEAKVVFLAIGTHYGDTEPLSQ
jgi:hypothetical protein